MEPTHSNLQRPYKPCPRCKDLGVEPPNGRAYSKTGVLRGYCVPCANQYSKDRNKAQMSLVRIGDNPAYRDPVTNQFDPSTLTPEDRSLLQWALAILEPKSKGRVYHENVCPTCQTNERETNGAYCKDCRTKYQRDRRERIRHQRDRFLEGESMRLADPEEFLPLNPNLNPHSHPYPGFEHVDPADMKALMDSTE